MADTGPSNGMPAIIVASDAPFMATTSYGSNCAVCRTVLTTWTSLRSPSANVGRSGRSVRRQVRIAFSDGRPSRLKNEPGIRPLAYIRSSTSIVSGKKPSDSFGLRDAVVVVRTLVSPSETTTAPPAWAAILPASKVNCLPSMSTVISCLPSAPTWGPPCLRPRHTRGEEVVRRTGASVGTSRTGSWLRPEASPLTTEAVGTAPPDVRTISVGDRAPRSATGSARCPACAGS